MSDMNESWFRWVHLLLRVNSVNLLRVDGSTRRCITGLARRKGAEKKELSTN